MKIICNACGRELEIAKCTARAGKWENLTLRIKPCACACTTNHHWSKRAETVAGLTPRQYCLACGVNKDRDLALLPCKGRK